MGFFSQYLRQADPLFPNTALREPLITSILLGDGVTAPGHSHCLCCITAGNDTRCGGAEVKESMGTLTGAHRSFPYPAISLE